MLHVRRLNGRKAWGISDDPYMVRWNRSTGACAMNVAYLLGSKDMVLLGFDQTANGKSHNWHRAYDPYYIKRTKDSNDRWMPEPSLNIYQEMMLNAFTSVADDFAKLGVTVWNINQSSKLKAFPFKPISELL
jgi:hypothetical protein